MSRALAEAVRVAPRFARSIRVETDLLAGAALEGFVCSASVAAILRGLARQYAGADQRAFTVTGTYGAGKSSLAVALGCLLGRDPAVRAAARGVLGADLADEVSSALNLRGGYDVVAVAGHRADPAAAISAALDAAARAETVRPRRRPQVPLAKRLREAAAATGADGVLLIVDEMGKLLEAAAAGEGDVQVFQEIAEAAARSGGRLIVVGLLHSAFEDYGGRLGAAARREWAKVQGRFADLPLSIGLEEQIDILARAVVSDRRAAANEGRASAVAAEVCRARPEAAAALSVRLHGCWPLEPLAAVCLSALARRGLGQAQRSLFAFLTSAEPKGFRDALSALPEDAARGYLAADLWDYLAANRGVAALGAAEGPRFALGLDALDRCAARGGGPEHEAVLKTVALLDLLRETAGCRATRAVLAASLPDRAVERLDAALADLVSWSVLVHRRHLDAYALFAGSDLDVGGLAAAARARLAGVDVARLNGLAALPPLVAKRHHDETGALRWFPVEVVALSGAAARVSAAGPRTDGAAGSFLLALPLAGEDERGARKAWRAAASQAAAAPVAVGLARDGFRVREAAEELLALEAVRRDTPELQGDAAARREVAARHEAAAAELEAVLRDAMASADWLAAVPGAGSPTELPDGSPSALTAAASRLAELTYPEAPKLRSDLLNRAEPSGNAVAARRSLLYAMVERSERPALGLPGFPPERGLHVALLERTKLHRPVGDGAAQWAMVEPGEDDPARLRPLWDAADALLRSPADTKTSAASLYGLWAAPPFGVRAGLLPVLAVAYLLSRRDRIAVSLDGTFAPAMTTFLVDRMLQEPGAVGLRWSEDGGARNAWLASVAAALAAAGVMVPADNGGRAPRPLDVARAVYAFVAGLPPWTARTARVGPRAQRLRVAVRGARDPLALLLDEVPAILGGTLGSPEEARGLASVLAAELRALGDAYPGLLAEVAGTIAREFRIGAEGGLQALRERARVVRGVTGDLRLDALAVHLEGYDGSPEQTERIAALAAHKPARDWTDRDVDAAMLGLAELAQSFLKAEALAHIKGKGATAEAIAVVSSSPNTPAPVVAEVRLSRTAKTQAAALLAGLEELIARNGATAEVQIAALVRALAARVASPRTGTAQAQRKAR
ncbi:hypothetical protein GCM10009416_13300 [Craurococcus roseus]|uniref:ATP-binding protein n=1 Tax=Craurococcus roseus TaxID=77585 RepID=A0ABN1EVZ7_9PROT